jgi:hypothetical protein
MQRRTHPICPDLIARGVQMQAVRGNRGRQISLRIQKFLINVEIEDGRLINQAVQAFVRVDNSAANWI